jgi:hypothetical protein
LRPVTGVTKLNPSIFSKVCLNFFSLLVDILESFLGSNYVLNIVYKPTLINIGMVWRV